MPFGSIDPCRNPELYLRTYWPGVEIVEAEMEDYGATTWPLDGGAPTIWVAHNLPPAQRRATLAHEMMHLERGDPDPWCIDAEEERVERQAARWLMPNIWAVRVALANNTLTGAASKLNVPRCLLELRLRHLTERETWMLFDPAAVA